MSSLSSTTSTEAIRVLAVSQVAGHAMRPRPGAMKRSPDVVPLRFMVRRASGRRSPLLLLASVVVSSLGCGRVGYDRVPAGSSSGAGAGGSGGGALDAAFDVAGSDGNPATGGGGAGPDGAAPEHDAAADAALPPDAAPD